MRATNSALPATGGGAKEQVTPSFGSQQGSRSTAIYGIGVALSMARPFFHIGTAHRAASVQI